ncbi:MAG: shikimate dehydrogenase [Eubacteriales bacterium]|nr:shikimate dehydrogenase [Eubacteriales bacterium]
MKKFCLIGYPLGHSMSPVIHKELFKINNIDASYELNEISPEDLSRNFESLKEYDGFNVTIPHKTGIIPALDNLSERAELFGAVNTVDVKDGKAYGHNTDCFGFLRALEMADIKLGGKALVCGSGGVSRMFAFESVLAGADLTIAVRDDDIDAAMLIKKEISDKLKKDVEVKRLADVNEEYDVMINGTPVGMFPHVDACVLSKEQVQKCGAVFDAVYNPRETLLIKYAKEAGIKCSNGLPMLVWQAAVAQEIWFGVKFTMDDVKKVLDITEREMEKL